MHGLWYNVINKNMGVAHSIPTLVRRYGMTFQKGHIPWNKGVTGVFICSEKTKEKHRKNMQERNQFGDRNPIWKNGITSDKEYWREYAHKWRFNKRIKMLDFLGGKCVKCGFGDYRALQIDHINGGGYTELKSMGNHGVYKNVYIHPENYQLLCANCNWIKRFVNNENGNVDKSSKWGQ